MLIREMTRCIFSEKESKKLGEGVKAMSKEKLVVLVAVVEEEVE